MEHAQGTGIRSSSRGRARARASLWRGQRELVGAQRPLQRMPPKPLDEAGAPDDEPACGPPRACRPRKQTRSAPARRLSAGGLVADRSERARAEVVHERQLVPARPRRAWRGRGSSAKPTTRLDCAREQQRRLRPDRPLVVGGAVLFVVPTSTRRAPERASTSGIGTRPRSRSARRARRRRRGRRRGAASASSTAAALLFTTSAASPRSGPRGAARGQPAGSPFATPTYSSVE